MKMKQLLHSPGLRASGDSHQWPGTRVFPMLKRGVCAPCLLNSFNMRYLVVEIPPQNLQKEAEAQEFCEPSCPYCCGAVGSKDRSLSIWVSRRRLSLRAGGVGWEGGQPRGPEGGRAPTRCLEWCSDVLSCPSARSLETSAPPWNPAGSPAAEKEAPGPGEVTVTAARAALVSRLRRHLSVSV